MECRGGIIEQGCKETCKDIKFIIPVCTAYTRLLETFILDFVAYLQMNSPAAKLKWNVSMHGGARKDK